MLYNIYDVSMLKTYLYVPDEIHKEVNLLVASQKKSKAIVLRTALREGLIVIKKQIGSSASALLKLSDIGKKYNLSGPRDLSSNIDKYLWDK